MLSLTSHIATSFLTLLTGLTISLVVARVINRLFWSPLSRFPGPRLAATTNIWQAFKGGQGTISRDLRALHVRTGCRILRYGPNHLSFWDPDAYKEIYVSQRFPKYPKFYSGYQMPHGSDSLFTTISNSASLARRRQLMPSLSRQSVIATEPLFHEQLAIFVSKLTNMAHERRTINLLMAFRCLTIDVISLYAFGRSIGTMQSEAFDSPLLRSFDKYVEGLYYRSTYPQIVKILDHLPSILQPACLRGYSTMKMLSRNALTEYRCQKRDYKYPVLFAKHVGQGSGLTDDELCSDAHTMVSAGSDTAGLTLALGIFYIYKNSEIRKRLHNELGAAYPHSSDVLKAHWADLEKLPFLSACVYESLRIAVPIGGDLPRVVTGGDWQFKGIRIPAGTVVSSSANAVNLNGDIFPEPQRFIPERWLDEQGRLSNAKETWLVSFSKGPRACIGQNMAAMAELYIFMAAVVRLFEAEIPTDKDRIDLLEHYGSVPVGYDCPAIFHRIAETID